MSEVELKTKLNVYRERTVQISSYEPVKVSASISQGFESFVDAKTIDDWMKAMEPVVQASLDRQVSAELERKIKPLGKETITTEKTLEAMSANKVEVTVIKPDQEIVNQKETVKPQAAALTATPKTATTEQIPEKSTYWKAKPAQQNEEWNECPKCHGRKKKTFPTCSRCK